jgi:hypothetical protein
MLSAYSEKVLLESMPQFTGYIESLELRGKFVRTKSEHAWYRAVSFYAATSNVTLFDAGVTNEHAHSA